MRCIVVVPRGGIARGKLAQAILHGAAVVEVEGSFDDALRAVMRAVAMDSRLYPLNSFNPWRLEGQKTLAYEVAEQLGWRAPDWVVVPVGNAGNIYAIWKGFRELYHHKLIDSLPRMAAVQAEGAAPIADAWLSGSREPRFVDKPRTIASAIRIGRPVNWPKAMRALEESKGIAVKVSDSEIIEAMRMLARLEGLAVEPASAASLAGLLKMRSMGLVGNNETVVLVLTGHGLKDPDAVSLLDSERYTVTIDHVVKLLSKLAGG
jgi:threonine synthase